MSQRPEQSKATLDGGSYHCGSAKHDKPFVTQNPAEWQQHLIKEGEHTHSGSARCMYCNETKDFKRQPYSANFICLDCLEKVSKQFQAQKLKQEQQDEKIKQSAEKAAKGAKR